MAARGKLKEQMAFAVEAYYSLFVFGSKLPPRKAIFLRLLNPALLKDLIPTNC